MNQRPTSGDESIGRVPPHNIEAEMSVLGALLIGGPDAMDITAEIINREDFYKDAHGMIYEAMRSLSLKREPIDIITLGAELRVANNFDAVGGNDYLIRIGDLVPTAAHVKSYSEIVSDKALKRRMIGLAGRTAAVAFQDDMPATDIVAQVEGEIAIASASVQTGTRGILLREGLKHAFDGVFNRAQTGNPIIGVATGFTRVDRILNGLHPGESTILAARPSMGKSSVASCVVVNAIENNEAVYVASAEMPYEMWTTRVLSSESGIPLTNLLTGQTAIEGMYGTLRNEEFDAIGQAMNRLHSARMIIDDNRDITPSSLRARVRRAKSDLGGLSLIVVDYLGLMSPDPGRRGMTRNDEVGEISKALQSLARETGAHVLALSQLSRAVEKREDKRPILSDLRDSGEIEQNADTVIFVYRPAYYDAKKDSADSTPNRKREEVEIIVAKQRNGPTAMCKLSYAPWLTRFDNISEDDIF